LLENIEFNNEVGNDRSYEECYQKLEKVIKDLLAEGANYTTQLA
jgi:exonuclease VII small subunit